MALLGEVEQAAGGADHDVDALAQRGELRLVGAAAVDGDDADAEVAARVGEVLGDLHAQLAGGHHDEGLRHVAGAVGGLAVGGGGGRSAGGTSRCSSGTPKPSVLPMPVRAWPMTSSPASASGRVSSWMANVRTMPASASACTISGRTPSSAKVGESSLDGGARLQGVRLAGVLGGVFGGFWGISGESSVGTDRVIASLRAQEPGPARRPPRRRRRPGGRADEALHAPGRLRLPADSGGRGRARSSARCAAHHTRTVLPASGRWSRESGHIGSPRGPPAAPPDGRDRGRAVSGRRPAAGHLGSAP